MVKILALSVILFSLSANAVALSGDTTACRCQYFSAYNVVTYKLTIDSLRQSAFKKYGNEICIGSRSFSNANVLLICKINGVYKGFFHDLARGKSRTIVGSRINTMAEMISKTGSYIASSSDIKPQVVSHDFSFFISKENHNRLNEVCYSQVLTVKDEPFGKMFFYFMKTFK